MEVLWGRELVSASAIFLISASALSPDTWLRLVPVSLLCSNLTWICRLTLAPPHHPELWALYKLIGGGMCPAYSSMLRAPSLD
jgi:hypothetical protein